jgi:branched-subunit amino acid aminotransferase/4-amino-4-deoxychorismate lyase
VRVVLEPPAPNTFPSWVKAGGNYLNSQLIGLEAQRGGYAEGIALGTNGLLTEGAGENLFLVRRGKLMTPPTSGGVLAGITRDTGRHAWPPISASPSRNAICRARRCIAPTKFS